jgi:RNA 2',3'-cyclic 3'-phosphodiesterase
MKRLFAAIKIQPAPVFENTIKSIASELRHERIKWVELHNVHLTLKFFGETEDNRIPDIHKALSAAASMSSAFTMHINRTGIFGSRYDPRVVWFGIDPQPEMQKLAENVVIELQQAGWEPDRQNFVPHLTIGRIKEIRDKTLFQEVMARYHDAFIQDQPVNGLILFESILKREGPEYIALRKFPLIKQ